jgi:signal transduction histidine kinase
MGDKKAIIFPSLLFVIFFFLITSTGFFLIRIIKINIENLLKGEGEIVYTHLKREIDINLEYLSLLEKSPAIITPNFLNIMVSDETIVEDLYNLMSDMTGNKIFARGALHITEQELRPLIGKKQETTLKIPANQDKSLSMGMRVKDRIFFFTIDKTELELLRKKFIIEDILEREEKRFNVLGINLYDQKGKPFIQQKSQSGDALTLTKPLDSGFLQGYTMEILISKALAKDTLKRTTLSFIFILIFLVIAGALSTFAIFLLQRKHEKKVSEMEKELIVKERLVSLGKLASGMAHEIRNPLNAMGLSVQRLKREFLPEEGKKEEYLAFLDIVRSELIRVDRIVEDFLLSARAHAPFVNENLHTVLDEVITIINEKATSREIRIISKIDPQITIESQKDRLKQAFYNIIINAIEAIGQKGSIEIWTKTKDGAVDIYLKDTGPGIKEEELHKVFEYYYTTKDKGMGLGLPISYMIVKDHGGDIRIAWEEGRGTTFIITLPFKQSGEGRHSV